MTRFLLAVALLVAAASPRTGRAGQMGRHLPEAAELDLNDVVGHTQLRGTATGEHWYRLMELNVAAERYEDAIDAGLRAAPWLEEARHLIAECYRRSGARS